MARRYGGVPTRPTGSRTCCGPKAALLICLTVVHVFASAGTARAQTVEAARAAFTEGRFIEAAELAESLETSEGDALAAEALAIHGYYLAEEGEKQAWFDRAAALAEEAIRLDAGNPEGYLQWAHAMGRYAQTVGVLEVVEQGYVRKVRDAIKHALALDPDMPNAHLSMAAWHAEAVNAGGFMAGLLYGASGKDALAHYDKALALAPDSKAVLYEYALGLLLLDGEENRDRARGLLVRATALPSKSAYDRIIHRRAVARLAVLDDR